MNEKFPTKTVVEEKRGGSRELNTEEIGKMLAASEKFKITQDFYRKAARDSAEEMLKEWLKLKEIKKFQKVYPQF